MSAEVQSLAAARLARLTAPGVQGRAHAAADYVGRAEDALVLLQTAEGPRARSAIVSVTETWLTLAEAQLSSR